jgi:pimeloyl-ACP methyl ester carboxylesterase
MDARGHGKSDKPHEVDAYDSEKRAGDIITVLDALKIESTNYLGNSMGGRLGYEIAKYFPSRVNSLIIGASNAAGEVVLENNELLTALKKGMESYIEFLERTGSLHPGIKAGILANDHLALYAVMKAGWPDTERYLPEMRMPFLLFAGEQAPEYHSMKEVSEVLPDAKFISVPDVGHGAAWARRDLILPHIKEFLTKVNK